MAWGGLTTQGALACRRLGLALGQAMLSLARRHGVTPGHAEPGIPYSDKRRALALTR